MFFLISDKCVTAVMNTKENESKSIKLSTEEEKIEAGEKETKDIQNKTETEKQQKHDEHVNTVSIISIIDNMHSYSSKSVPTTGTCRKKKACNYLRTGKRKKMTNNRSRVTNSKKTWDNCLRTSNSRQIKNLYLRTRKRKKMEDNHLRTDEGQKIIDNHVRTVDNASDDEGINKETLDGSPEMVNDGSGDDECVEQLFEDNDDSYLSTFYNDNADTSHLHIKQNEEKDATKVDQDKMSDKLRPDITNDTMCKISKEEQMDPKLNANKLDIADSTKEKISVDINTNMNDSVHSAYLEKTESNMHVGGGTQEEHSGGKYSLRKRKANIVQILMKKNDKKRKSSDKKRDKIQNSELAAFDKISEMEDKKMDKIPKNESQLIEKLSEIKEKDKIRNSKSASYEKIFEMEEKTEKKEADQNISYCDICAVAMAECKCLEDLIETKHFVTCAECNQGFSNLRNLRVHLSYMHNKTNVFRCPNCHKAIPSQTKLKSHYSKCKDKILNLDSDEDGYQCSLCFEDFQSGNELQTHLKLHKPDSNLVCNICKKVFESNYKLRKHKIKHSVRGLPYKCTKCPKVFSASHLLKSHLVTYHKLNKYVCRICSSLFPSLHIMIEHRKTHNKNTCMKCSTMFQNKEDFSRHMKTHEISKKRHQCEICGKRFEEVRSLKNHMLTHSDTTPYHCDQCEGKFKSKDTLRKHKTRVHSKTSYMCDLCGKLFNFKGTLDQHKRKIHTEKKIIHSCSYCERKFGTLAGHHQHILDVHCTPENVSERTNFKVHKCQHCTKMFARKHKWEYHMNVHIGSRPYKCVICPAAYPSKSDLRIHKLTHEERKHKCIVCNSGFINISKYKVHLTSQKHKFNMEKASNMVNNNSKNNSKIAETVKDILDDESREKRILGKKGFKIQTTGSVINDREKDGEMTEVINSEEFCNEVQIISETIPEGVIDQTGNETSISVIDGGTELMDIDNSVLVVVTNNGENEVVGDYILQECDVVENEAVHTIIAQEQLKF